MSSRIGLCCKNWYFSCFMLLVFFIFSLATPLFAAEDEEFMLEEITVTAEKREAELQKVPMDITVVRPDEMDRSGIYSIYDLKKVIPDMETSTMTGNQVMVSIRGVGGAADTLWNPIHETTTAIHIDGIQLTKANGFDNMFFDLQRVEVLKGPQGTLYGRGSTAGSMNMLTQKPILDDFTGHVIYEEGNYDLRRSEAAVNVPVMEKLAFRVAGRWIKKGGYSDAGDGSSEARSGRLSMTWQPTDKDTITATFDMEKSDSNGYGNSGSYFSTYGGVRIVPIAPWTTDYTTVLELPYKTKWYKNDSLKNGGVFNDSYGFMAQWERELPFGYGVMLYGHRDLEEELSYLYGYAMLSPFAPGLTQPTPGLITDVGLYTQEPYLYSHSISEGNTDSLEMRLLSKETITNGDKYEWVVGAMGQDDETSEINDLGANYWVNIKTKSYGLFAQAAYEIYDKLNLSIGYRRAMDEKEYTGDYRIATTGVPYKKVDWDENIYKINLNWFVTDNSMTFVQYSKGYKTGNINYGGEVNPPEFMDSYEAGFKTRFLDNKLQINGTAYYYNYKNYTKWTSVVYCQYPTDGPAPFEGAVSPNGVCYDIASDPADATYHGNPDHSISKWDYVNQEDAISISVSPGGAEQMGADLNVIYLLTMKDTFLFNGSYSKNEYKDYNIGAAILALYPEADNARLDPELYNSLDGEAFGSAPYRFNVGYSRTENIGMDMLTFNTTAYYNGKSLDQIMLKFKDDQYNMPGTSAYWTMDASLTYSSSRWVPQSTRWTARLWCNNIFGSEHLTSIYYTDMSAYFAAWGGQPYTGYASGNYISPRTYGLTLTYDF
jgi:outer membrane receptor protein involved in Fe transport